MSGTQRFVPLPQVSDLMAPGQPLPFRILDSMGRLLLAKGQRVLDARQLTALLERGACVVYEEAEAARAERARNSGTAPAPSQRTRSLFDRWEQQVWSLDALLRMLGRDKDLALQLVEFADEHIALIDKHVDAALFTCTRQDDHRYALYALSHGLHTAALALLCGRNLGWSPERQRSVVLASLTMNASIMQLQAQLAEQADPPSKKQLEQIREHPKAAAQLLRDSGVVDVDWLAGVDDHHERPDGGGYPRALTEIGEVAHVLRVTDVFMAKISPRANREPMLPQVAARQLYQEEAGGPVAAALIKAIGVYPPGDFVRLKNGDAAVVVRHASVGQPILVASIIGANGKPVPGAPRRDTSQPEFTITGPLLERKVMPRILGEQIYGLVEG